MPIETSNQQPSLSEILSQPSSQATTRSILANPPSPPVPPDPMLELVKALREQSRTQAAQTAALVDLAAAIRESVESNSEVLDYLLGQESEQESETPRTYLNGDPI